MSVIADGLLIATALVAALYCAVLSSRLRRLARSDDGIGGQIGALTAAVDEAREALAALQGQAGTLRRETSAAGDRLRRESAEARRMAGTLETATAEARKLLETLENAPVPLSRPEPLAETPHAGGTPPADEAEPPGGGPADHAIAAPAARRSSAAGAGDAADAPRGSDAASGDAYRVVTDGDALAVLEAAMTAAGGRQGRAPSGGGALAADDHDVSRHAVDAPDAAALGSKPPMLEATGTAPAGDAPRSPASRRLSAQRFML